MAADSPQRPTQPADAVLRHSSRPAVVRFVPALVLLAVGAAALVYGATFRDLEVLIQKDFEVPPELLPTDPFGMPSGMPKIPDVQIMPADLPESDLVRDVTYGGLERLIDGELQRTYREGSPPSACPT